MRHILHSRDVFLFEQNRSYYRTFRFLTLKLRKLVKKAGKNQRLNYSAVNRSTFRYANTGLIPPQNERGKINGGGVSFRHATCDQVLLNYFILKRSWQTRNNSYRVRSYAVCLASVSLRFRSKESREELRVKDLAKNGTSKRARRG